MHTEGVEERVGENNSESWLVRQVCVGCGLRVGAEGPPETVVALVDRVIWSDDARHVLDRMPPYVAPLYRDEVEAYAKSKDQRVVTWALLAQARQGGAVAWDVEAEQRLHNVPAPVRAMARMELERTAADKGLSRVTVSLMEEVKARYFGLSAR